jgi:uncharacterized protein (TIGR00369 family)
MAGMSDGSEAGVDELRDNDGCFACGKSNPAGLRVDFKLDRDKRTIHGRFAPARIHEGYAGIVHGGILSTLLDEAMVKLSFMLGIPAVTAEMTVKFRTPAAPGDELTVTGWLSRETRRLIEAESRIEHGGILIAEARGKLMRV